MRQRSQYSGLVLRVKAVHVQRRLGLGVAHPLCIDQNILEVAPLRLHLREYVIAGAVEDAVQPLDAVAAQPLAQRLDDRDAAGDRCLVVKVAAVFLYLPEN